MSQTPVNPFDRSNPQRRDDWDAGFAAGVYEGQVGKLAIERARDEARADVRRLRAALEELADSFATFDASDETNDKVRALLAATEKYEDGTI